MKDEKYVLRIEITDKELFDLAKTTKSYAIEYVTEQSSGGIETLQIIISIIELVILIVEYPVLLDYIKQRTIIVKTKGFTINDNVRSIIKQATKNEVLLNELKDEYINKSLHIEGNAASTTDFLEKLERLISDVDTEK